MPTGREDEQVTFRAALKNQYEEVLFQCEDDRYELDLVVELNASTIRFLEPIRAQLAEMTDLELHSFKMREPLEVLHQRSIERLYGAEGHAIMDAFYENPSVAVPVILSRLKQKDREWRQNRRDWDRIWREVSDKNQMRALDHESLGFKNTDKKNFTSKPLVAELQLRYQERLQDIPQGKMAVEENAELPHLSFPFVDSGILADIEGLVMYTLQKRRGDDQPVEPAKAQQFFTHFAQNFFGYSMGSATPVAADPTDAEDGAVAVDPSSAPGSQESAAQADDDSSKRKRRKQNSAGGSASAAAPAPAAAVAAPEAVQEAPLMGGEDAGPKPTTTYMTDPPQILPMERFYANKRFYVFFRVFATLAARLRRAKELELDNGHAIWKPFNIIQKVDADAAQAVNGEGLSKYAVMLINLRKLLAGDIDSSTYEDEIRAAFGIHSYVLFTLDRLLDFMCQKLTPILTGDETVKLLGLWEYELKRSSQQGLQEPTYGVNAREVVGPRGKLIRLTFVPDQGQQGALNAPRINEPPRPPSDMKRLLQMELLPSGLQPRVVELTKEHAEWCAYVDRYVHGPPSDLDVRKHQLFLRRNTKLTYGSLDEALADTGLRNGIRAKISLATFRMFYASPTEDVFVRQVKVQKAPSRSREAKFQTWLSTQGF